MKLKFLNGKALITVAFLCAVQIFAIGCGPRGETKSLDEILRLSKERYSHVRSEVSPNVSKTVEALVLSMDGMVNPGQSGNIGSNFDQASKHLLDLIPRSGYTTRPSMSELMKQYSSLAESKDILSNDPRAKLIVARTYSVLASELETTKFSL